MTVSFDAMEIKVPITHLSHALNAICWTVSVERFDGRPLDLLSPEEKREAIKLMDELGALELREAVNKMAEIFGMSRVWVYKCLKS